MVKPHFLIKRSGVFSFRCEGLDDIPEAQRREREAMERRVSYRRDVLGI